MRFSMAMVLAVAVAGCGNKDNGSGDMAMPPDMTVMNTGDMAMNATCSVTAQDCGAAMKCIPTVSGQMLVGKCGMDGTVAEGGDCMPGQSQTQLLDNCKAGSICDNTGTGNDNTFKCRKICSADSGCSGTDKCIAFDAFGWCLPTCTPFGTNTCGTGADCGTWWPDISSTMSTSNGFFTCKQTGAGTLFADCMGDSDCAAGLWCDTLQGGSNTCLELCDTSGAHNCTQPPADAGITTLMCNSFADQTGGKGYCSQ